MKIKILGPVLLLTLATQFARAAESVERDTSNNNNKNHAILDTNVATVPAAPDTEQVVALNSQKAGEALEYAVDGLVEAAARTFENDEDEDDNEEEEDTEVADTDEDEEDDEEDDEEKDDEDLAVDEDQDHDEAFVIEGDDFHYADPLTATYEAQIAKCKQPQLHHQEQQPQEQQQEQQTITIQKRDQTKMQLVDEPTLSALATAEVGGACIDSFVNFALRFRERCSIKCLKTFTHIISNPNVLGILDCFGCSNFFVSGFYALGVDCAGLFAAYPKPANATAPKTTPTATGVPPSQATKTTKSDERELVSAGAGDYRLGAVKPEDSALPPIDFATTLKSLGQLTSGDVQDWFNIGSDLAKVIGGGATNSQSGKNEGEGSGSERNKEMDEAKAAAGKDLFNKFVSKAASFGNWTLTPEVLDQTGVFDRVHSLGLL
ncbi:hypothetical protein BGZ96_005686 [Linnemannia gamsii]|uniref:Uncharacterized protein n=1 Tax=Linnemannia gamsii TaxID=64522 RepID=A0ABQ7KFJ3_9FUNG|nr:hypothetical protein BGZ96_005686 [Linnemannia gamsii]